MSDRGFIKNFSGKNYYGHVRPEIITLVPDGTQRVLDVGCGEGGSAAAIKTLPGVQEVMGIEFVEQAAQVASSRLDRVIVGDIETLELDFPVGYFDCIICADVLEHCKDPWAVLRKLHVYLASDGVMIASIPNLRNLVPLIKIVCNRWEYEDEGILDRTHLRFFTSRTMLDMFRTTGYLPKIAGSQVFGDLKFRLLRLLSLGLLKPFSVFRYIIVAKKKLW
ncbi:MAG: class I SAM-dependent methyltransferase [Ignavibacteria bacterium]|nr:class I SAM-dependent methyltransferase [Ignavibacteria bacterium]